MDLPRLTGAAGGRTVLVVLVDYAGASARLTPELGLALDPRCWGWQVKVDGMYARASTDRDGRIRHLVARSGALVSPELADGLVGLATGLPDAVLHGELEASTEAGARARAARGWSALHLFDASRWCGRDVARLPFAERHGLLHRWQADVECYGEIPRADWWEVDYQCDAHGPDGRYVRPVPRDLRRLPIVPIARGRGAAEQLWREHVELGGGEGLVAVRLDAPLRARAAKRKVKATETLDCRVLAVGGGVATVEWRGHVFPVSVRTRAAAGVAAGDVLEVACDGFYERAVMPRFARAVRVRRDLAPG